jgi:UDP-N-acetylmuramate: L-alanyl-gamma-D-glutamyl-meso-diaminopimelate ligase
MNKWIHIVGIAGVATSALAVMFKNKGWTVTGSDKAFFPPSSTYLTDNGIKIMVGFDESHLYDAKGDLPDLVMYQGMKGENNPEIALARKLELKMDTFSQILNDYIIVPNNSIMVVGTYGKTTITAALVSMFINAGVNISYMFGGTPINMKANAAGKEFDTKYSIIEGDEYIVSTEKPTSKFFEFPAKYLIINSMEWEHLDIFKTEQDYIDNFAKLIEKMPSDGLIIANSRNENIVNITSKAKCKVIYYSYDDLNSKITPMWTLVKSSKPLPCFMRRDDGEKKFDLIPYEKAIIGGFNEENLLAASALAYELGIKKERIQESIRNFDGIKRRLEVRFKNDYLYVIDDLGSSPPKAQGGINAIRDDFPNAKLLIVFEPNAGNRVNAALPLFDKAFDSVDELLISRFTRLPLVKDLERFDENDFYQHMKDKIIVNKFDSDSQMVEYIEKYVKNNKDELNIVLFLSSHNLRGMVEDLIKKFQ